MRSNELTEQYKNAGVFLNAADKETYPIIRKAWHEWLAGNITAEEYREYIRLINKVYGVHWS